MRTSTDSFWTLARTHIEYYPILAEGEWGRCANWVENGDGTFGFDWYHIMTGPVMCTYRGTLKHDGRALNYLWIEYFLKKEMMYVNDAWYDSQLDISIVLDTIQLEDSLKGERFWQASGDALRAKAVRIFGTYHRAESDEYTMRYDSLMTIVYTDSTQMRIDMRADWW